MHSVNTSVDVDFTEAMSSTVVDMEEMESKEHLIDDAGDDEYEPVEEKYSYYDVEDDPDDDLPYKYRHMRQGLQGRRPEYYVAMNRMKAEHHMSEDQAQGRFIFDLS